MFYDQPAAGSAPPAASQTSLSPPAPGSAQLLGSQASMGAPASAALLGSKTASVGGSVGSLSQTLPCVAAPVRLQPSLPEQLINSVFVSQQPEGLSVTMYGPLLTPMQQRCTHTVHMKCPGGDMQHVMDVIVAEHTEDKGILVQSGENLPVCYLDTRNAVRSQSSICDYGFSGGRYVNIYDFIPNAKTAENPMARVKETGHRSYDMVPVLQDGSQGNLWYRIQFLDDCANFIDSSGRLQANMKVRKRDGEDKCTYVLEISHNIDASVILSGLLSVIKLS